MYRKMVASIGHRVVDCITSYDHLALAPVIKHLIKVSSIISGKLIDITIMHSSHFDLSAWFGGDPHLQSLSQVPRSCNVLGSFIYAQTTLLTNQTAINASSTGSINVDIFDHELFSIFARTSTSQARLRAQNFFNQNLTYFSSFSMYLGSKHEIIIDVSISTISTFQFCE